MVTTIYLALGFSERPGTAGAGAGTFTGAGASKGSAGGMGGFAATTGAAGSGGIIFAGGSGRSAAPDMRASTGGSGSGAAGALLISGSGSPARNARPDARVGIGGGGGRGATTGSSSGVKTSLSAASTEDPGFLRTRVPVGGITASVALSSPGGGPPAASKLGSGRRVASPPAGCTGRSGALFGFLSSSGFLAVLSSPPPNKPLSRLPSPGKIEFRNCRRGFSFTFASRSASFFLFSSSSFFAACRRRTSAISSRESSPAGGPGGAGGLLSIAMFTTALLALTCNFTITCL